MNHSDVWIAVEKFAEIRGYSCSGLARRCGLDSTVFNKSKRFSKFGQPRWLSFGTIAKMLSATGATINDFIKCFPQH